MLNQQHVSGPANESILEFGTGASIDGTFRSVGAFDEQGLVAMPHTLNFIEAATLTCAGITAWNALFGLTGNRLMPGQWVLTQGTGGVSIFALQFAKATGARVIATTSSPDKVELLKGLGADYVINYRQTPNWGSVAKGLTGGSGIDIVVDVAGATTLKQSADSVKVEGLICVVGIVGGDGEAGEIPTLLDAWKSSYTVRGILVGSRMQMEEMCRAIDGNPTLRPFVDPHTFKLDQLKEAYEYLSSGNNQGKVGIDIL
ncbi:alcohol dehydrogenase [Penicillium angulare]|uniref:alcohol dehydrogenase n=1 Tax=Penicillium angulare TaxID=116970 RepID=UPI00253FB677|nr:alcohol dehydrogenase [Penicillium angulare]KAJ5263513.1 alcohol dehydrogenase [Penicillium angulare]